MNEKLRDLFTEEEWSVLLQRDRKSCEKVQDLPMNMEASSERMRDEDE
ncbi:MAG: hypothetical protein ACI4FY_01715 [Acetatifactor sp.]